MKKLYLLAACMLLGAISMSCSDDSLNENGSQYASDDGFTTISPPPKLPPPPPPPRSFDDE